MKCINCGKELEKTNKILSLPREHWFIHAYSNRFRCDGKDIMLSTDKHERAYYIPFSEYLKQLEQ